MALADYRLCDVCQDKAFYDSELSYDFKEYPDTGLYNVGAWGVLCRDCIKTHRVVILPVDPAGVAAADPAAAARSDFAAYCATRCGLEPAPAGVKTPSEGRDG